MNEFKELSRETLAKIRSHGIKSESVIKCFKRSCRLIESFLQENDWEFTPRSAEKWFSELMFLKCGTKSQRNLYLSHRRAMLLLLDLQSGKLDEWKIYSIKIAQRPMSDHYGNLLELYRQQLVLEEMSESTISFAIRVGSIFFLYLERLNIDNISNLTAKHVSEFWGQDEFSGRKPAGVHAYAYKLKKLMLFLEDRGITNNQHLHLAIPRVFAKQVSIVTTLSSKAEKHLTSSEKLSQPLGKRDHAMILLALRLGMRRSDIANLKLRNINWKNDTITFIQQKTKVPVTLPLLADVGNALMDYVLHSRGEVDADEIFIRGYAPYKALKPSSVSKVSEKYLSEFGSDDCPEKGFHILRKTAATKLFENNVPSSVISAALGHLDPNSADVYLSTDSNKMRKCALDLSGIQCANGELL